MNESTNNSKNQSNATRAVCEVLAIACLFFAMSWSRPPDVNEAHYLCKAKHFWDSGFCKGDIFLESSDAHWFFLASFGLLTKLFTLEATAWIGRFVCWMVLAVGWRSLANHFVKNSTLVVLSAGLFVLANRCGHLAGEWVVGGVEAKCIAYGVLFLGISFAISGKYFWMWCLLGVATLFHALVGLWGLVAIAMPLGLVVWRQYPRRPNWSWKALVGFAIFGLLSTAAIVPALAMNSDVSLATLNRVYLYQVTERLSHHQYLFAFAPVRFVAFGILLIIFGLVGFETWSKKPNRFVHKLAIASLLISLGGALLSCLALQGVTESCGWLRLYWFRIADVLVPLAVVLSLSAFLESRLSLSTRSIKICFGLVVALAVANHAIDQIRDPRSGSDRQALPVYFDDMKRTYETQKNWESVCDWIRDNTNEGDVFITPTRQQTFKWYSHRSEVVSWKDAPQNANDFLEWRHRIDLLQRFDEQELGILELQDAQLSSLAAKYGADYLLVPQSCVARCQQIGEPVTMKMVYPDASSTRSTYVVFRLGE